MHGWVAGLRPQRSCCLQASRRCFEAMAGVGQGPAEVWHGVSCQDLCRLPQRNAWSVVAVKCIFVEQTQNVSNSISRWVVLRPSPFRGHSSPQASENCAEKEASAVRAFGRLGKKGCKRWRTCANHMQCLCVVRKLFYRPNDS